MEIHFKTVKLTNLYALPFDELGKTAYSKEVVLQFKKKIDIMKYVAHINDLKKFSGLNFEKLKGRVYQDCFSIRVNKQYRIIFKELKNGSIAILILELSKHYE
ncbi:hypothetical protein CAP35_15375 [Chitinophagaceae bacterium IBVUCB1]|nr:hypothetical protein CAP35_15375 [Chitinophagaceae bacterium IBVUCB1]